MKKIGFRLLWVLLLSCFSISGSISNLNTFLAPATKINYPGYSGHLLKLYETKNSEPSRPPQEWQRHIAQSKQAILEAANQIKNKKQKRVLILGAGNAAEIPLEELARQFKEVILVDLDEEGLKRAKATVSPRLQRKIKTRVLDLSHNVVANMMERIFAVAGKELTPAKLDQEVASILTQSRLPALFIEKSDYIISSVVVTDIYNYLFGVIKLILADKYQEKSSHISENFPLIREAKTHLAVQIRKQHLETIKLNLKPIGRAFISSTEETMTDFTPMEDDEAWGRYLAGFWPRNRKKEPGDPLKKFLEEEFEVEELRGWVWTLKAERRELPGWIDYDGWFPIVRYWVEAFVLSQSPSSSKRRLSSPAILEATHPLDVAI